MPFHFFHPNIAGGSLSPWTGTDLGIVSRRVHAITRGLGWTLAILGIAGTTGWLLAHGKLAQPAAGFPPDSLIEPVAIFIIGLGLVSAAAGRARGPALAGAAIICFGVAALIRQIFHVGPEALLRDPGAAPGTLVPLSVPVSSALLFLTAGVGLIGLALPMRLDRSRLAAGTFGAILAVLSLGLIAVRLMWRPDAQGSLLVGSSVLLLAASLLLGSCLGLITWSSDPDTASTPWVPLTLGVACLATSLFLWRALVAYEQDQIRELTRVASHTARLQIEQQVNAATKVLSRIARFSPRSRVKENSAVALTRDVDGLRGIVWLDSAYHVIQVRPQTIDSAELRMDLERLLPGEMDTIASESQPVHYFTLSRPNGVAIALPYCGEARCSGYQVGIFDSERLLEPALADSGSGFIHAVAQQRRTIVSPPGRVLLPVEWTQHSRYAIGNIQWDLVTWPSDQTLNRLRSGLPDLLLLLGLLVSTLLPLAIRLGQMNLTRARLAERVRVNLALETATDGIWEWDVTTGNARRSAALWRHLGYNPGAMSTGADPWSSLIHPNDQTRVMNALSDHLSGLTQTFEARYRIRGHAGDWHWVIDRGRVVERSPTGQPRRVLGISADVTDRQRADEALAASERRFRASFDSAAQVLLLLDADGRVLEANHAALDFTKLDLPALRGLPLWELPCWRDGAEAAGEVRADVLEALEGAPVRRELELVDAKGEVLLLELLISPIHDAGGQVFQLLADGRDITVRRRAEDVLREVESLTTMGRMAARVAHEINNPLAGIQNAFLLIKDAVPADHPHRAYVGAVEREIARIAGVTRQLYETYRPEQNGAHGTSVTGLVSDAVALLEQINRGTGVKIDVNLTGVPGTVRLPEAILRQALYNLVQNAVEASPPGGVVEVVATVDAGVFILRVRDRGPGIPAEIRERVFEPFFTTKSATVRTGGMGLGLSLVGRSVQALGGHVEIHDRDGGGTEFVVRLPIPPVTPKVFA
ncbi:MAG TPA: ATP-binding protein [Gemmatimonadales bacterium]|nr:ATP-binding protein [Gemmatimonadales bacterium]